MAFPSVASTCQALFWNSLLASDSPGGSSQICLGLPSSDQWELDSKCHLLQESVPLRWNWHISTTLTCDDPEPLSFRLPHFTFSITLILEIFDYQFMWILCHQNSPPGKHNKGLFLPCVLLHLSIVAYGPVINTESNRGLKCVQHFKPRVATTVSR